MVAKYDDGNHAMDEAYRGVRTSLAVDKTLKTILITSSEMNEGKTTTASNIATCFAELEGKSTILIDCDFRKRGVSRYFGIDNDLGITELIYEKAEFYDCLKKEGNLHILTSGKMPKSPSALLDSKEMVELVEGLSYKYDYVFIDSPPISRVNDACIIAKYVDGTVIVSASKEVDQELAKITKSRLEKVNANIVGVVLNKFKCNNYKYYGYYGYYDEYEKPKSRLFKKRR